MRIAVEFPHWVDERKDDRRESLLRPRGWGEAGAAMSRFRRSDRLYYDEPQRRGVARVR